jgi:hypothetical protein
MADALKIDVIDGGDERAANYTSRIVANLSRVLAREAEYGQDFQRATEAELRELLGLSGEYNELVHAFDELLAGPTPELDNIHDRKKVLALLQADVERRLVIARPDYRQPPSSGSET